MSYTIHTMTKSDLALAIQWANAEGWNPGRHDLESFYATDPEGFFIGKLDGKPISCISAVTYGTGYGFVGFYIVVPEFRGKGYGLKIWKHAMAYLGNRTAGLDGVPAQQENYRKSGFEIATRNVRYLGKVAPSALPQPNANVRLVPAGEIPFETLSAFDRRYYPAARDTFLSHWLKQRETVALAALSPSDELIGYGAIRPAAQAWRIGPLFAQGPATARALCASLARHANGEPLCFDGPEANPDAAVLAKEFGLEPAFPTARMYTPPAPKFDLSGVYGVTSLELG